MENKKLNIAIIGYGKMGKAIGQAALQRGHELSLIIDNEAQWEGAGKKLQRCDVAIEFSTPESAVDNIKRCFDANTPVICGTTGWLHELPAITRLCHEKNSCLFYASNFSIGVNFFFELNKKLAGLLANMTGYKARIIETHHAEKLDTPSGTAISLANDIIDARPSLTKWADASQELPNDALPIKSFRIENITGTHVVCYDSMIDSIEIKHTAHNRSGFAEGALLAAEWVKDKQGVFNMKDLLNI